MGESGESDGPLDFNQPYDHDYSGRGNLDWITPVP